MHMYLKQVPIPHDPQFPVWLVGLHSNTQVLDVLVTSCPGFSWDQRDNVGRSMAASCFAEVWAIQPASCRCQATCWTPWSVAFQSRGQGLPTLWDVGWRGSGFPHGNYRYYSGHKGVTEYVLQILGFPSRYIPQNSANQFWFPGSTGLVFGLLFPRPNLKPCNYSNCRLVARCVLMFFV